MSPLKRSVVWQYFEKKNNEFVLCKLCNKELRFNSSTTNMRHHLKSKNHPFVKLKNEEGEKSGVSVSVGALEDKIVNCEILNYQKLVVPVRMRSIYWKCYGFPASETGEILTKSKVVCLFCKYSLSYTGNTSSLKLHLQNKHAGELVELESRSSRDVKNTPTDKNISMKIKEENIYMTNISGTIVTSNGSTIGNRTVEEANAFGADEISEIHSSHVNVVYEDKVSAEVSGTPNKSNMEAGGEQSSSIENLHPFMIPIETKSVSDAVTEFIIMDMQLPDIVEGQGFQRLIAILKSPSEIPSKSKLVDEIIPRIYDTFKESIQETFQHFNAPISLSVEEWETNVGESYVTFSVSYKYEKDENLFNKVLSTVHCDSSSDNSYWDMIFDNMLEEWNLKLENMSVAVCATTRQELLDTFKQKGLVIVPCLVHTLQDVCTKVCLNQVDVREILEKCRKSIFFIYKSNNAIAALRIQDHLMLLEETPLVADNPRVWLSTYSMLEAVLVRRQVLSTILDNIESPIFDKEQVNFSDEEWSLIEDVIIVLEPFKVTIMTLYEERTPLVSLLKPLLWQLLCNHLKPKNEDSVNVQIFKSALKTLLSEKYSDPDLNELLNISTTLDPRFKSLPNMVEEAKSSLYGPIKDSLIKLIEQSPKDEKPITEDASEKKKPRLLGMVMMLGEMCPAAPSTTSITTDDRANLELVQYQSEATATLEQCPMAWWSQISPKCPHLARLASQYTCIPAAAVPSSRIALDTQLAYVTKRANLTPEIIDRIIFLNANHSL